MKIFVRQKRFLAGALALLMTVSTVINYDVTAYASSKASEATKAAQGNTLELPIASWAGNVNINGALEIYGDLEKAMMGLIRQLN